MINTALSGEEEKNNNYPTGQKQTYEQKEGAKKEDELKKKTCELILRSLQNLFGCQA